MDWIPERQDGDMHRVRPCFLFRESREQTRDAENLGHMNQWLGHLEERIIWFFFNRTYPQITFQASILFVFRPKTRRSMTHVICHMSRTTCVDFSLEGSYSRKE